MIPSRAKCVQRPSIPQRVSNFPHLTPPHPLFPSRTPSPIFSPPFPIFPFLLGPPILRSTARVIWCTSNAKITHFTYGTFNSIYNNLPIRKQGSLFSQPHRFVDAAVHTKEVGRGERRCNTFHQDSGSCWRQASADTHWQTIITIDTEYYCRASTSTCLGRQRLPTDGCLVRLPVRVGDSTTVAGELHRLVWPTPD